MGRHTTRRAIGDVEDMENGLQERREALRREQLRAFEDAATLVRRAQQLVDKDDPMARADAVSPDDDVVGAAERIINGNNEMVHVHFLSRALRASKTVARISLKDAAGNVRAEGTGSMISPTLLLTNWHVFKTPDMAARGVAEFGYELDFTGLEQQVELRTTPDPTRFYASDPQLDVAVVALVDAPAVGANPLTDAEDAITVGSFVNVIQHPEGQRKQIALRENRVLERHADLLWYAADTMPGSSGAPVFNDQFVLVALHRKSIPKTKDGTVLRRDGTPWDKSMPKDTINWIANEGVAVHAVRAWLASLNLASEQAELRDQALGA